MRPALWFAVLACRQPVPSELPEPAPVASVPSGFTSYSDPTVDLLRSSGLEGFDVKEGYYRRLLPSECAPVVEQTGMCMGNNPLAPYLAPQFPEDDALNEPIGAFQLGPDEAVVMVGFTPESRYFSYQFHLHTRLYDDERRYIVSTLARSLHVRNLQHAGEGPDSAGQYTAMIWAANETVAQEIRAQLASSLAAQGIPRDILNTVTIPYLDEEDRVSTAEAPGYEDITVTPLWMGYEPDADVYGIAIRIAGIDFESPYIDPAQTPMAVFKVTPTAPVAYNPFPYPLLPPPRDSSNIASDTVRDALTLLADAVEAQLPEDHQSVRVRYATPDFDGFLCCDNGYACGNSDDALYMQSANGRISAESTGGAYTVGVVHTALPEIDEDAVRLAYSGLALRNVTQRMGIVGRYDAQLLGTARLLFPDGVEGIEDAVLDRLYVQRYARDCGSDPLCTPLGLGPLEVPPEHEFNLTERAYLDLSTNTGPHHRSIIAPFIVFHGESVTALPGLNRVEIDP